MTPTWHWEAQNPVYGSYGNANQWTVSAGIDSLARETTQNSSDAKLSDARAELTFSLIRLRGTHKTKFLDAIRWNDQMHSHLSSMATSAEASVFAGQIGSGVDVIGQSDALLLLRIEDSGCTGLTGPELPLDTIDESDFGNFIKLCRLDLFSGKEKGAGGSFGLGKAVYWRFSRLQTVIFHSVVAGGSGAGRRSRVFGVNQGVLHRVGESRFQGRGYFGQFDSDNRVTSIWDNEELIEQLYLGRSSGQTGTSALVVGFYDPDQPERGSGPVAELKSLAADLRKGIEENFWPMLTRQRMTVNIEILDGTNRIHQETVDPAETYAELVHALEKFDSGDLDDDLSEIGSVIERDVVISIPARKDSTPHSGFEHRAKLVIALSDNQPDSLENQVCLLRQPEMVVQTFKREFEGRSYHAFLLAGMAVNPSGATELERLADDFLRFAEPPAHDRWVPGAGRNQAPQVNLNAHYKAPYLPSLKSIETSIYDRLIEIFGVPPVSEDAPPESIFKNLQFLRGEPGGGGGGTSAGRAPEVIGLSGHVVDGRWEVNFTIRAKNRPEGWAVLPQLAFVGLDGTRTPVRWESLKSTSDSQVVDGRILIKGIPKGRVVRASVAATSVASLPIPAAESVVEVVVRDHGVLLSTGQGDVS